MTSAAKINVCNIQRFCVHDGPGIRTTVFLQGCPLRCWWCHNPAMQAADGMGNPRDVTELLDDVVRDARYWMRSGGGVTLSGGEPLLQADACTAFLATLVRAGYEGSVETSGYARSEAVSAVDRFVALWLFDLKTLNKDKFRQACGGELATITDNLRMLLQHRPHCVWVRIPLIRGHNDDETSLVEIGRFLASLPAPARLQVLPGHGMSVSDPRRPAVNAAACLQAQTVLRRYNNNAEICW